jgi:hypothetical protein
MRPKRPSLHPQLAARQPYGGQPIAKVSRTFITPHYSFARCAPHGRHCTHSGPHGSHTGGNLVPKCRELLLLRTTHSPDAPQTAATAPTVGRTPAIWGETYCQSVENFYYSALLIRPMCPTRPPLQPQWAARHGGKPSAKVSESFPQTAATAPTVGTCAPNGRHCSHSGPHGSHTGGNLVSKRRENLLVRTTHSPNAPPTAATAPTVGPTAAIWGET